MSKTTTTTKIGYEVSVPRTKVSILDFAAKNGRDARQRQLETLRSVTKNDKLKRDDLKSQQVAITPSARGRKSNSFK